MLKPSAFILALFAMFSTSVLAQDLRVCPNVQVGKWLSLPSIYSDCTIQPNGGGFEFPVMMAFSVPNGVYINGSAPAELDPTPTGDVPFGEFDGLDMVAEDMGPNYTGTCSDMAASIPTSGSNPSSVDGNVYCSRFSNTEGNQVWLRGTVDVAGNTWKDPIVLTNQPGVGTPYRPKATVPVPVLPFWGLLSLAGLIGLFGFRKLRA
jgi:hypothetical protein